MAHWRKRYHIQHTGWIEAGTSAFLGWLGMLIYSGLVAFWIWLLFVTVPKVKAATVCQSNQIEGLAELARDLGVKPSQAPTIATGIGCDGRPYDFVALLRAHTKMMKDKR